MQQVPPFWGNINFSYNVPGWSAGDQLIYWVDNITYPSNVLTNQTLNAGSGNVTTPNLSIPITPPGFQAQLSMEHTTLSGTQITCSAIFPTYGPPATWVCSGASTTLIDRYNAPVAAGTCYDDGSGMGDPDQNACNTGCVAPPPAPTWVCSGANTTLVDLNNNPVNAWNCYDDGLGTGNPSQTACQAGCVAPTGCGGETVDNLIYTLGSYTPYPTSPANVGGTIIEGTITFDYNFPYWQSGDVIKYKIKMRPGPVATLGFHQVISSGTITPPAGQGTFTTPLFTLQPSLFNDPYAIGSNFPNPPLTPTTLPYFEGFYGLSITVQQVRPPNPSTICQKASSQYKLKRNSNGTIAFIQYTFV